MHLLGTGLAYLGDDVSLSFVRLRRSGMTVAGAGVVRVGAKLKADNLMDL